MPENIMDNYADVWKSTNRKLISRVPYNNANDNENPTSEEDFSPPPEDDSTYNLEDDITPPEITPPEGSQSVSDETGDSVEDIHIDSSEDERIIPNFLFQLRSETRALNIEFNRLLLDLESIPTTSNEEIIIEDPIDEEIFSMIIPLWNITERCISSDSSTSSSPPPSRSSQRYCKTTEIVADDETVSTDCEVNTDLSSIDNISLSLESTESEKIIPSFLFKMFENLIFFPEFLDFEDDSKATDNDVNDFSASALTLDEDYFAIEPDSAAVRIWIETEITEKVIATCDSRSSTEGLEQFEELCNKALPTPDSEGAVSTISLEMTFIQKDDEEIIPRYLYI